MSVVVLAATVWLGAPGEARALTIRAAKLTADPEKGDSFRVKGRLGDLSIDGAEQLLIALDGASVGLPLSEFKRKKRTLVYRGDGAAAVVADSRSIFGAADSTCAVRAGFWPACATPSRSGSAPSTR